MNIFKRIMAAVLVCCTLFTYTACRDKDGSGATFKYDIAYNPGSLDPQTADDESSDLIIACMFRGLLTAQPDGSLASGVAQDYTVSEDGLVYTFTLREDVYWTDKSGFEAQCTAHDFVFAFQRLFDPDTRAARASDYFCIKNAELVNKGYIPDKSQIGVKALGDFVLELTLAYPNPQLPVLLTQTPAMPCNEEYFTLSKGKYGLYADATPSNGAFYISAWSYDPYTITDNNSIVLRRNAKNSEVDKVYPSGLNFFIVDSSGFVEDFNSGVTSCIAVTDEQTALIGGEATAQSFSNISVGLTFNMRYELLANADFRRALASLVNYEELADNLAGYDMPQGVVPFGVTLLDQGYREYAGEVTMGYSAKKAEHYYSLAEDEIDKNQLVGARIILPDDTMLEAVSEIMQAWQAQLGFYCKVEVLSQEDYLSRLQSGDYEIAVTELSGGYNSPEAYLKPFTAGSSENYGGYSDKQLERLISLAGRAVELSESADYYVQAEQLIISEAAFIPLCCKNVYFYVGEDMCDISYNPFTKTIDFSKGKKF